MVTAPIANEAPRLLAPGGRLMVESAQARKRRCVAVYQSRTDRCRRAPGFGRNPRVIEAKLSHEIAHLRTSRKQQGWHISEKTTWNVMRKRLASGHESTRYGRTAWKPGA